MTFELTGNLREVIGLESLDDLQVELSCNQSAVLDPAAGETWLGAGILEHANGVFTLTLPEGDESTMWRVTARWTVSVLNSLTRKTKTYDSGWFPMTADADLTEVSAVATTVVDASLVEQITTLVVEAQDAAAEVAGVVAMSDGVMTAVDADPDSDYRQQADARLLATVAALKDQPPFEMVPLTTYGHSYSKDGAGADNGTRLVDRLAKRLNTLTPTNYGQSGRRMDEILMFSGSALVTTWVPDSRGLVIFDGGIINDERTWLDGSGHPTTREAFRSCLTYLTARAVLGPTSAAFIYGPGWSAGTTSTVGSYVDVSFTGDACSLLIGFVTGSGGTLTVKDTGTGTTVATVNTGGYKAAFNGAVKVSGYGAGNHTVRVTLTAGSATLVGLAIPNSNPPTIVWVKEPDYTAAGASELTRVNDAQAACQPVADAFGVVTVDSEPGWDSTMENPADGTHPNDKGNAYRTSLVEAALRELDFRQGQNRISAANSGTYTPSTPSYAGPSATAPAAPTVTVTADNQLLVTSTVPTDGGATITTYDLSVSTDGSSWTSIATGLTAAQVASYRITSGLTAGSNYYARVRANNSVGAGAWGTSASTATAGASITVHAADTFTRADAASTPGSTETGSYAWAVGSAGSFGIQSNQLRCATIGDLFMNDGQANGTIQVKLNSAASVPMALAFRRATDNSFFILWHDSASHTGYRLSRRSSGGTFTTVATWTGTPAAVGDVVKVVLNGSSISCYLNGALLGSVTDATNQTETRHGVWVGGGGTGALFDDFSHNNLTS